MIPGMSNLSEGAVSKVAEIALSSQLDKSEKLKVDVSTDPALLADGTLDAMVIYGEGLVMQKDLRMEEMKVNLGKVSVNPLKAIAGNLELSEPTQGNARIVIIEPDLNRAFNSDFLDAQMGDIKVQGQTKSAVLETEKITCHLLDSGDISIKTQVQMQPSQRTQDVTLVTTPRIRDDRRGVILENVRYQSQQDLSPELTQALLEKAKQILDLSTFEMPGIQLELERLQVQAGKLTLDGIAHVTQLPS